MSHVCTVSHFYRERKEERETEREVSYPINASDYSSRGTPPYRARRLFSYANILLFLSNAHFTARIFALHAFAFYSTVVVHFIFARMNAYTARNTRTRSKWYTRVRVRAHALPARIESTCREFPRSSHSRSPYHVSSDNRRRTIAFFHVTAFFLQINLDAARRKTHDGESRRVRASLSVYVG